MTPEQIETCVLPGCVARKHVRAGYCAKHWTRIRRHGDPEATKKRSAIDHVFSLLEWRGSCLIFTGTPNPSGYGATSETINGKRVFLQSHRVVYERTVGPIPEGMMVLHSCDVPLCCNPDHLRVGTHDDNMRDRAERGRTRNGAMGPIPDSGADS